MGIGAKAIEAALVVAFLAEVVGCVLVAGRHTVQNPLGVVNGQVLHPSSTRDR